MGSLSNLFKYKKQIDIKDIDDPEKVVQKAWIRILGDEDLKDAYRFARIVSSERRMALRDEKSSEYRDETAQLDDAPLEGLISVILAANESMFANEATAVVEREDLPKIEELATQPDAPTLEEQERLDTLIREQEEKYKTALEDYVNTKLAEIGESLTKMERSEVVKMAKKDLSNIQALDAFVTELNDQKGYRGTYDDEECKIRSFDSIDDFKSAHTLLKSQIIQAYNDFEIGNDDVKN